MWTPTVDDVVATHERVLALSGGERGILHMGPIEAAVSRCEHGPFPGSGTVFERAAFLLRIAQDHPFVDGNKRAAYEMTVVFLAKNGFEVHLEADTAIELVLDVATAQVGLQGMADRLAACAREL